MHFFHVGQFTTANKVKKVSKGEIRAIGHSTLNDRHIDTQICSQLGGLFQAENLVLVGVIEAKDKLEASLQMQGASVIREKYFFFNLTYY